MTARVSGQEEFQTGEDEVGLKHSIIPLIEKQVRNGYILIQCDMERASRVHSIKANKDHQYLEFMRIFLIRSGKVRVDHFQCP